jgi:DNA modification methylase
MIEPVFKRMSVAQLQPWNRNPRDIDKVSMEGLQVSMDRFGLVQPIVWNKRTGRVVGGHQRLKVLMARGAKETTVGVVDLSEEDERALNISLNNPHITGDFTADLQGLLADTMAVDIELFRDLRLDELLEDEAGRVGSGDENQAPGLPENPVAKSGQLWRLGEHRLVCGSSADAEIVAKVVGEDRASCMWTDPPYGVNYGKRVHPSSEIANDATESIAELLPVVFGIAEQRVLLPGAAFYIAWSSAPGNLWILFQVLKNIGWRGKQMLVWAKDRLSVSRWDYHPRHEQVLYGNKPGKGRHGRFGGSGWYGDHKASDVFEIDKVSVSVEHPTMKPVELVRQMLANSTRPGDYVYEPFAGSGSTLIACEQLSRRCLVIELEPAYCDVIIERWQTYAGGKAVIC